MCGCALCSSIFKYKNVGSPLVLYSKVKAEAQQRTFHDIVMDMLNGVMDGIDILGGHDKPLYYDGSKYVAAERINSIPYYRILVFRSFSFWVMRRMMSGLRRMY